MSSTDVKSVGIVLGTRDAAPLEFWVGIDDGCMLQLDDLVVVQTWRPNCPEQYRGRPEHAKEHCIRFYGVVDAVRKLHEGVQYDSDTKLALEGTIPVNVSYAAHVIVTRVNPEEFIPPHPGDCVYLASGEELDRFVRETEDPILSTDDNLYLEYATPKGNVLNYHESLRATLALLDRYRTPNVKERHLAP